MKTEEIKQMAEAKALEKYPHQLGGIYWYKLERQIYAQAIIDNYEEQERVNEKLLDALKLILNYYKDGIISSILEIAEEAIQSAQQQEKTN